MELTLTAEEHDFLLRLLEQRHRELQTEISHTDHHDFRSRLRQNERLIEALVARLRMVPAVR